MRWITWLLSYMYSQIFAFSNPISFHVIFVILRIQYWDFFSKSVPCKTIFIMPERNTSFSCVYMSKQKISKQTEWNVQNVAVCLVFFFIRERLFTSEQYLFFLKFTILIEKAENSLQLILAVVIPSVYLRDHRDKHKYS